MKILLACDKFRGSLSAKDANTAILKGLSRSALAARADAEALPIADGGEGTMEALEGPGTERVVVTISDPFGAPADAAFLFDAAAGYAVIELATAAGHDSAARHGYDPDVASSHGVGELIAAAARSGARRVIVALGGSVTVDGGAGALQALGARYRDRGGDPLDRPAGRALARVAEIDLDPVAERYAGLTLTLAADVDNPLLGERGAARVFGPQKGVAERDIDEFDAALAHFDAVLAKAKGSPPLADTPFAGAAGGMMVGLSAVAGLEARDGLAVVAEHHGLRERIDGCDLVVTGEGSLDAQSLGGKGPVAVARLAHEAGVPAIAFAGRLAVGSDELARHGIAAAFAIARGPMSLEEALANGGAGLTETAANAFNLLALGLRSAAERCVEAP